MTATVYGLLTLMEMRQVELPVATLPAFWCAWHATACGGLQRQHLNGG